MNCVNMQNLHVLAYFHHRVKDASISDFAFNATDQIIYLFTKDWKSLSVSALTGETLKEASLLGQPDFVPEPDECIISAQYIAELECVSFATRKVLVAARFSFICFRVY